MEVTPKIVLVSVEDPPAGLLAELGKRGLNAVTCGIAAAEETLETEEPLLVVLSGSKGAQELSMLLEDQPDDAKVQVAIVAPRRDLARLMGLNREIVVALLATEMGDKTVASRAEALCRQATRRRGMSWHPTAARVAALSMPAKPSADGSSFGGLSDINDEVTRVGASPINAPEARRDSDPGLGLSHHEHERLSSPDGMPPAGGLPKATTLGMPQAKKRQVEAPAPPSLDTTPAQPESLAPDEVVSAPPSALKEVDNITKPTDGGFDPASLLVDLEEEESPELASKLSKDPRLGAGPLAAGPLAAESSKKNTASEDSASENPAVQAGLSDRPEVGDSELEMASVPPEELSEDELEMASLPPEADVPQLDDTGVAGSLGDAATGADEMSPSAESSPSVGMDAADVTSPVRQADVVEVRGQVDDVVLPPSDRLPSGMPGIPGEKKRSGGLLFGALIITLALAAGGYVYMTQPDGPDDAKVSANAEAPRAAEKGAPSAPTTKESSNEAKPSSKTKPSAKAGPGEAGAAKAELATEPADAKPEPPIEAALAAKEEPAASTPSAPGAAPAAGLSPIPESELLKNPFLIPDAKLSSCEQLAPGVQAETNNAIYEASLHWDEARAAVVKGDTATANKEMCIAVAINPESPAREGLARLYVMAHSPEQALVWIQKILAAKPGDREALNLRGDAHSMLGKNELAESDWLQAMGLQASQDKLRFGESKNYAVEARRNKRRGDLIKAAQFYRRAVGLDPTNVTALTGLAEVLLGAKHLDNAATFAVWALQVVEAIPEAHVVLGDVSAAKGNTERARVSYERALRIRPDFWPAKTRLRDLK